MGWFKKDEIDEVAVEPEVVDEEVIVLSASGSYKYLVGEVNDYDGFYHRVRFTYDVVVYPDNKKFNNSIELKRFNYGAISSEYSGSRDGAYQYANDHMKNKSEEILKMMKSDIIRKYRKHLSEIDVDNIKVLLNTPVQVSFTVNVPK